MLLESKLSAFDSWSPGTGFFVNGTANLQDKTKLLLNQGDRYNNSMSKINCILSNLSKISSAG